MSETFVSVVKKHQGSYAQGRHGTNGYTEFCSYSAGVFWGGGPICGQLPNVLSWWPIGYSMHVWMATRNVITCSELSTNGEMWTPACVPRFWGVASKWSGNHSSSWITIIWKRLSAHNVSSLVEKKQKTKQNSFLWIVLAAMYLFAHAAVLYHQYSGVLDEEQVRQTAWMGLTQECRWNRPYLPLTGNGAACHLWQSLLLPSTWKAGRWENRPVLTSIMGHDAGLISQPWIVQCLMQEMVKRVPAESSFMVSVFFYLRDSATVLCSTLLSTAPVHVLQPVMPNSSPVA